MYAKFSIIFWRMGYSDLPRTYFQYFSPTSYPSRATLPPVFRASLYAYAAKLKLTIALSLSALSCTVYSDEIVSIYIRQEADISSGIHSFCLDFSHRQTAAAVAAADDDDDAGENRLSLAVH